MHLKLHLQLLSQIKKYVITSYSIHYTKLYDLKTAACAKHFAVHSGPEKYRHEFNAITNFRDLHETYLPAFKALVKEGKVKSVMGAYNRVNGEACCASQTLLVDILKKQWGFNGFLTTDCGALEDIYRYHKLCATAEEAAALAAKSGMNLNCGSLYGYALKKAVEQKLVTEKEIDELLYPLILVITSYSIHYTKLYDVLWPRQR